MHTSVICPCCHYEDVVQSDLIEAGFRMVCAFCGTEMLSEGEYYADQECKHAQLDAMFPER